MKKLKVCLVRGLAGKPEKHIKAVRSLGLKKVGDCRILEDNPMVRGNIKVSYYLLEVQEVEG
ncbi:50S ribosomal protein L30 [Thermocrinis sp.]